MRPSLDRARTFVDRPKTGPRERPIATLNRAGGIP
jgi:hypothetical protein